MFRGIIEKIFLPLLTKKKTCTNTNLNVRNSTNSLSAYKQKQQKEKLIKINSEFIFAVTFLKTLLSNWMVGRAKTWTWIFISITFSKFAMVTRFSQQRRRKRIFNLTKIICSSHWGLFECNLHPPTTTWTIFGITKCSRKSSLKDKRKHHHFESETISLFHFQFDCTGWWGCSAISHVQSFVRCECFLGFQFLHADYFNLSRHTTRGRKLRLKRKENCKWQSHKKCIWHAKNWHHHFQI